MSQTKVCWIVRFEASYTKIRFESVNFSIIFETSGKNKTGTLFQGSVLVPFLK